MIRLSTSQMFNTSIYNMMQGQGRVNHTNNQLGSGKQVITPADDPVAAAQTLNTKTRLGVVQQHNRNVDFSDKNLSLTESVLDQTETALIRLKEMAIQLGSDQWSEQQIKSSGTEAKEILSHLQGLLNTKNESNEYIFAGSQADKKAYDGNEFQGDRIEREAQVADSTFIKMLTSGARAFEGLENLTSPVELSGKSYDPGFVTKAGGLGNADLDAYLAAYPDVTADPFPAGDAEVQELLSEFGWDGAQDEEEFFNSKYFKISGASLPDGGLEEGELLQFRNQLTTAREKSEEGAAEFISWLATEDAGAFMFPSNTSQEEKESWIQANWGEISNGLGEPWSAVDLDLTVDPVDWDGAAPDFNAGGYQSALDESYPSNMLGTIQYMVDSLGNGSAERLNKAGVRASINNLDIAFEKVSQTRSQIGARQNTLDAVKDGNKDFELFAQKSISDLEDLDYAEAISRFQQQTMSLQASQQAFSRVQNLSLFNYI